jgi:hypothetical protein
MKKLAFIIMSGILLVGCAKTDNPFLPRTKMSTAHHLSKKLRPNITFPLSKKESNNIRLK